MCLGIHLRLPGERKLSLSLSLTHHSHFSITFMVEEIDFPRIVWEENDISLSPLSSSVQMKNKDRNDVREFVYHHTTLTSGFKRRDPSHSIGYRSSDAQQLTFEALSLLF